MYSLAITGRKRVTNQVVSGCKLKIAPKWIKVFFLVQPCGDRSLGVSAGEARAASPFLAPGNYAHHWVREGRVHGFVLWSPVPTILLTHCLYRHAVCMCVYVHMWCMVCVFICVFVCVCARVYMWYVICVFMYAFAWVCV